jgi:hypothetical protein
MDDFYYSDECALQLQILAHALVLRPILSLAIPPAVSACFTTVALVNCWIAVNRAPRVAAAIHGGIVAVSHNVCAACRQQFVE